MALSFHGFMVSWFHGFMVSWFLIVLLQVTSFIGNAFNKEGKRRTKRHRVSFDLKAQVSLRHSLEGFKETRRQFTITKMDIMR